MEGLLHLVERTGKLKYGMSFVNAGNGEAMGLKPRPDDLDVGIGNAVQSAKLLRSDELAELRRAGVLHSGQKGLQGGFLFGAPPQNQQKAVGTCGGWSRP
jgi:hypothetical protein